MHELDVVHDTWGLIPDPTTVASAPHEAPFQEAYLIPTPDACQVAMQKDVVGQDTVGS